MFIEINRPKRMIIGPNEACPCKQGKKFKHCCGRTGQQWMMSDEDIVPQEFRTMIDQIEEHNSKFLRTSNLEHLQREIDALERIVGKPTYRSTPLQFQLKTYHRIGLAYWNRFELQGNGADLDKASFYYYESVRRTPTSAKNYSIRISDLGKSLEAKFRLTGDQKLLKDALKILRRAVDGAPIESQEGLGLSCNLAASLLTEFENFGVSSSLDEAIDLLNRCWKSVPSNWQNTPFLTLNLATAYWLRFEKTGVTDELKIALDHARKSISMIRDTSLSFLQGKQILAIILLKFYEVTSSQDYLKEAITEIDFISSKMPSNHPSYSKILNCKGLAYFYRYAIRGSLADLETAAKSWQAALAYGGQVASDLPGYVNNYSGALSVLCDRTGNVETLNDAIKIMRTVVGKSVANSPEISSLIANLSLLLWKRYKAIGEFDDLEECLLCAQEAFRLTAHDSPQYIHRCIALGNVFITKFEHEEDIKWLESGIKFHEKAKSLCDPRGRHIVGVLNNLAWGLAFRFELLKVTSDYDRIVALYRDACEVGKEISLEEALRSARNWGDWAFDLQDWEQASVAYSTAENLLQRLLTKQVMRPAKESWLREIQGISSKHTFALAKLGNLKNALATFERGRARLLSETLERTRTLKMILKTGKRELCEEFEQSVNEIDRLVKDVRNIQETPFGATIFNQIQKVQTRIEEIIKEASVSIAELSAPSYVPDSEMLNGLKEDECIVCLSVNKLGGLALVIRKENIEAIFLEFNRQSLNSVLIGEKYFEGFLYSQELADDNFKNKLSEILKIVGKEVMLPIINRLRCLNIRHIILVPSDTLGLLPLHAAIYEKNGADCCVLDEFSVIYSPNIMAMKRKELGHGSQPSYVGISNPVPHPSPLPETEYEIAAVSHALKAAGHLAVHLNGLAAARDKVLSAVENANIVHFACHAVFDYLSPFRSRVELSDGSEISLLDIAYGLVKLQSVELIVLSACQTALADFQHLPDESIGFTTAFLEAGANQVLSTLWPIQNISTVLLIARFAELYIENGMLEFSDSLREAQLWLRGLTDKELSQYLEQHTILSKISHRFLRVPLDNPERKQFSHPYYWAAFILNGNDYTNESCVLRSKQMDPVSSSPPWKG